MQRVWIIVVIAIGSYCCSKAGMASDEWSIFDVSGDVVKEVTVSPSGEKSACGVYSLYAAAQHVGRQDVRLEDVVRPTYLRSHAGSTLDDLRECARDQKLEARAITRMTVSDIKFGHTPLLLHVRSRPWSEKYDHWICVMGTTNEGAVARRPEPGAVRRGA